MTGTWRDHTPLPRCASHDRKGRWERAYPGAEDQIRRVRADLRPLLPDCPIADDVILVTSELATNAARHSYSGLQGGTFTVRAILTPGASVLIEVEDDGGPWAPGPADPARCHGLDIVGTLAADWNIQGDDRRRIVWARLDWPAPAGPVRQVPAGIGPDCHAGIEAAGIPATPASPGMAAMPAAQPHG